MEFQQEASPGKFKILFNQVLHVYAGLHISYFISINNFLQMKLLHWLLDLSGRKASLTRMMGMMALVVKMLKRIQLILAVKEGSRSLRSCLLTFLASRWQVMKMDK